MKYRTCVLFLLSSVYFVQGVDFLTGFKNALHQNTKGISEKCQRQLDALTEGLENLNEESLWAWKSTFLQKQLVVIYFDVLFQ